MLLTDIQIRRSKPQEKAYALNDGQGLSLLINTDGSKGWRFRYRWTLAYREEIMRTFEQDVFPYIGHSPIAEIKPLELLEALRRIENA